MGKPRSPLLSSFSLRFISSLALHVFHTPILILLLDFRNVVCGIDEFDPLIELPGSTLEYFRKSSGNSGNVLYVNHFGARGNGNSDDTEAFRKVWKVACSSSSPTKIVVPDGETFLLRPIDFSGPCRSKVTLTISGTIVAPEDPDIWDGLDPNKWLYFHGINYLTIEGGGKVDGNGQKWWARSCKIKKTNPCRRAPKAMTFHRCKNLNVGYITVINGQQMHMAFTGCRQIVISNLSIFAPAHSPNTDGIHISASINVEIRSAVIGTGDDCISIVSNSSKIQIKDITCGPGHGISIGSLGKFKSRDEVHDIAVNGVKLSNTENGVRIKSWQGGSGYARNIAFENVFMDNVSNPIIIDQYYCDSKVACRNQTSAVNVGNISYIGVIGTSATLEAVRFSCSESSPCTGLFMEDIQLVSYNEPEEFTASFCWNAYGSSLGFVYPPPCLAHDLKPIIQLKPLSTSNHSIWI